MADANRQSAGTIWLPTGNPDTTNITPTDFGTSLTTVGMGGQPGSLGIRFEASPPDRAYQRVQLDSGATSSTSVGVVAANQLAFWKDKSKYIVTNDVAQANVVAGQSIALNSGFRNFVAGIFRSAVTAGNYCDILQRGRSISVKTTGSPAAGDFLVCDTSTSTAQATPTVAGATQLALLRIGIATGPAVSNVTPCDVDIPEVQ